jgi:hypothetical protein
MTQSDRSDERLTRWRQLFREILIGFAQPQFGSAF